MKEEAANDDEEIRIDLEQCKKAYTDYLVDEDRQPEEAEQRELDEFLAEEAEHGRRQASKEDILDSEENSTKSLLFSSTSSE